jgi:tetratricopeptide (TPR) repeat protein
LYLFVYRSSQSYCACSSTSLASTIPNMNSESTFSDALSEVDVAIAASDFDRAIALTDELRATRRDALSLWRVRARAFEAAGKWADAADAYGRVLDIAPADAPALAGNARALLALGQVDEARRMARQALDHMPANLEMARLASDEGEPYEPDATSQLFREASEQLKAGLFERAMMRLRHVSAQWPLRTDAQVTLAHALWRSGRYAGAAEVCQSILDAQPDCLDAHALLLALWGRIGPVGLNQVHLQAIERIDPDHRCTNALLGDASPLAIRDVPAMSTDVAPLDQDDEIARRDWVDNLVAAAMSAPKPLERAKTTLDFATSATPLQNLEDDDTAIAESAIEGDGDGDGDGDGPDVDAVAVAVEEAEAMPAQSEPLQWAAEDTSTLLEDEAGRDEIAAEWLAVDEPNPGSNTFVPTRPANVVPDAADGIPTSIEPLQWEAEGRITDGSNGVDDEGEAQSSRRETTQVAATLVSAIQPIQPASTPARAPAPAPAPAPKKAAERIADARRALEEGRWDDAVASYRKAIASARGKKLDGIIADLEAVAKVQPSSKRVHELLGEAYARRGDWQAARAAFNRALELTDEAAGEA